jgi:methanogenic corrinoid protein MtbC1
MQDQRNSFGRRPGGTPAAPRDTEEEPVLDFASWVVALLAARRSAADMVMRPDLLARLLAAATRPDDAALAGLLRAMLREKVSAAAIADLYIPAAAAELGDAWMDDRMSFAEVSLGAARLQAMLRALGAGWSADGAEPDCGACVLLCVVPGEQHTLGALVLLGQLRRAGVSVRLAIGPDGSELARIFGSLRFDGALVSASGSAPVAAVAAFVTSLRKMGPPGLRVVIGGGLIRQTPGAAALTGADAAAAGVDEALAACGVRVAGGAMRRRA